MRTANAKPRSNRDRLQAEIAAIRADDGAAKSERIADAVVESLSQSGQFHRPAEGADFPACLYLNAESKRIARISDPSFEAWLSGYCGLNRAAPVWKYVVAALGTHALTHGEPVQTEAYWARRGETVYISSGAGMYRITRDGIDSVPNGTDGILFERTCEPWNLLPREESQDPFKVLRIFRRANLSRSGRMNARLWLHSLPALGAKKPILCIKGPLRSGKTGLTAATQVLATGRDPRIVSVDPDRKTDVWLALDEGGVAVLDNYDKPIKWLPDLLAAASTGAVAEKRRLYSDKGLVGLRPRAAIAVTSIDAEFAGDPGLADRLIVIELTGERTATRDGELFTEIRQHRDACLSFIAHVLSAALADEKPTPSINLRHPDYSKLAVRIARVLGVEEEAIDALQGAELDKSRLAVENDPVGAALLHVVRKDCDAPMAVSYTAAQLRQEITRADASLVKAELSTHAVAKRLQLLWPHLQRVLHAEREELPRNMGYRYIFRLRE